MREGKKFLSSPRRHFSQVVAILNLYHVVNDLKKAHIVGDAHYVTGLIEDKIGFVRLMPAISIYECLSGHPSGCGVDTLLNHRT